MMCDKEEAMFKLKPRMELSIEFWSEQSACAARGCWHKRRWPLLLAVFFSLLLLSSSSSL